MSAALKLPNADMSDAEWHTRCELAALYHVVEYLGWTDLINTHMSARIPAEPNCFLINNYGEMFDEITASSLVKMDMDGRVYSEGGKFNNAVVCAYRTAQYRLFLRAQVTIEEISACTGEETVPITLGGKGTPCQRFLVSGEFVSKARSRAACEA